MKRNGEQNKRKERRNSRHQKYMNEQRALKKETARERQRLKALPKALRKLETELCFYVEFMEIYNGYIGDFTGDVIPTEPVENPFLILQQMELHLQHPNALSDEEKIFHCNKLCDALQRMCFYTDPLQKPEMYNLLFYFINNPPQIQFGDAERIEHNTHQIIVERMDTNYYL